MNFSKFSTSFFTLIIALMISYNVNSQSVYEYGIKFADENNATLVGADGLITKTTDGGITWEQQNSNTTNVLYGTEYIENHKSVTVGENGFILRSDDATTWTIVKSSTIEHLRSVSYSGISGIILICGDNGTILRSDDMGYTFVAINTGTNNNLYSVTFAPSYQSHKLDEHPVAFAVGDNGTVLESIDDGLTWAALVTEQETNLRSISFSDGLHATVVGCNGLIMNTADGAATWTISQTEYLNNFNSVKYLDSVTAIAVGDNGVIARSVDNGASWETIESGTEYSIMSVNFANTTRGISVGESGTTLYTNDGGLTWTNGTKKNAMANKNTAKTYTVKQNFPNPFNPSTQIYYSLPFDSKVSLKIYDMVGKEVAQLVNNSQTAGEYTVTFNASKLASGVYFYRLYATGNGNEFSKTMKMILTK